MLQRTCMICWKEFIQIIRDFRTLAVVIVLPILMLILYGYAINFDVKHLKMGIWDQDTTSSSRDLIDAFTNNDYFAIERYFDGYDEITDSLDRGTTRAVLVIPKNYAKDLAVGRKTSVQLLVDGSDSTIASTAIGYMQAVLEKHSAGLTVAKLRKSGVVVTQSPIPIDNRIRFWYNPELKSSHFLVPGLIAVILMMLSALLTSMTVVREKERGTIEGLIVSPVMPYELMLGKLLPYLMIAFVDVITVLLASQVLFHVPLMGSPALLLLMSVLFLIAALSIGLFISSVSASQQVAMTIGLLLTLMPSILLSGFLFPINAMPAALQGITYLIPARHFLIIARGIFLKGNGITMIWQPALFLLVFGLLMLGLSSLRFRKKL